MNKFILLTLFCGLYLFAATNTYFNKSKEGWFYYQDPKKKNISERNVTISSEKQQSKKEKDATDPIDKMLNGEYATNREEKKRREQEFMRMIPVENLNQLSADEYREIESKAREISVMNPTKENLQIYLALNKFQVDQADRFMKVWMITELESPELSTSHDPTTKFAIDAKRELDKKDTEEFFKDKRERLGYVVFYKDDSLQVKKQKFIYSALERQYGVTVEYMPINDYYIKRFKLVSNIENFFVYRGADDKAVWRRIKSGMIALDEIVETTKFLFENTILEQKKVKGF